MRLAGAQALLRAAEYHVRGQLGSLVQAQHTIECHLSEAQRRDNDGDASGSEGTTMRTPRHEDAAADALVSSRECRLGGSTGSVVTGGG